MKHFSSLITALLLGLILTTSCSESDYQPERYDVEFSKLTLSQIKQAMKGEWLLSTTGTSRLVGSSEEELFEMAVTGDCYVIFDGDRIGYRHQTESYEMRWYDLKWEEITTKEGRKAFSYNVLYNGVYLENHIPVGVRDGRLYISTEFENREDIITYCYIPGSPDK